MRKGLEERSKKERVGLGEGKRGSGGETPSESFDLSVYLWGGCLTQAARTL